MLWRKYLAECLLIKDKGVSDMVAKDTVSLLDVQKYQAEFDAQWFDKEYFKNDKDFEKLRHILLHLMKTVGKMAAYCEMQEHGKQGNVEELTNAVLPDLYLHALQLANLLQVDLGVKYEERMAVLVERNKKRLNE